MTAREYESPAAFKEALEHRIRARTPKDAVVARTRQLLVFDRFLARIAAVFGDAATLKGGVRTAMSLRFLGVGSDGAIPAERTWLSKICEPPVIK